MLRMILTIAGKPGLYKLLSQGKNILIVESLQDGKRLPTYSSDRMVSLGDISMFTDSEDVPLRKVLQNIKDMLSGAKIDLDYKKASNDELRAFMEKALPSYDRDRVHPSDMRKLVQWYNILVDAKEDDFSDPQDAEPEAEPEA